jgi:hypothetical protein
MIKISARATTSVPLPSAGEEGEERLSAAQRMGLLAIWITLLDAFWWEIRVSPSIAMLGSYNLSVQDPSFAALLIALSISMVGLRLPRSLLVLPVLGLLLIFALNMVQGLFIDPTSAMTWLRVEGALAPFLLLGFTVPYSDRLARAINRAILIVAALTAALLIARLTLDASLFMVDDGLAINEGRPIAVHGASIIAMAAGILMANFLKPGGRWLSLAGSMAAFAMVVLSGQGTVLICTGVIIGITFGLSRGRFAVPRLMVLGTVMVFAIAILVIGPERFLFNAGNDWATQRLGNVSTRQAVWSALLTDYKTREFSEQLVGIPAGPNRTVYVQRNFGLQEWAISMHSMYIGTLSRFGAIGLAFYLAAVLLALFRLFLMGREADAGSVHTRGLSIAFLVASLILGYSYELRGEELLLVIIPLLYLGRRPLAA